MALTDVWTAQVGRRKRLTAWKVEENVESHWEEPVQNSRQSRDREAHAGSRSSDLARGRQEGLCRPGGMGSSEALLGLVERLPGWRIPSARPTPGSAEAAGGACFISEDAPRNPVRAFPLSSLRASLFGPRICLFGFPPLPSFQSSVLIPIKRHFLKFQCLPQMPSQGHVPSCAVAGLRLEGWTCPVPILALSLACRDRG